MEQKYSLAIKLAVAAAAAGVAIYLGLDPTPWIKSLLGSITTPSVPLEPSSMISLFY